MIFAFPLISIAVALGIIAVIVIRKFPQLANLDLSNLPEEKMYQKKKEIINRRIEKSSSAARQTMAKGLLPLISVWKKLQLQFRVYVGKIQRLLHHEQSLKTPAHTEAPSEQKEEEAQRLIQQAEQYLQLGNYQQAEQSFLAAIKIKPREAAAYRGLGDTYLAQHSLEDARQTYAFLLKLEPDDDSVLVKLAEIAESQGDLEEAIQYYQQAALLNDSFSPRFYHLAELLLKVDQPLVAKEAILQAIELEPQNPKYLDLLTETAIICGDKALAWKGYSELRLVNPDNQKLASFKDRIYRMSGTLPDPALAHRS